jgi:hypothetical protein
MSDYDPDKLRFHSAEEGFNPGYVMGEINRAYENAQNLTDLLYNSNGVRISKERYVNIKDLLNAAKQVTIAYRGGPPIGRLTTDQQRDILSMVNEVLEGKRECVQFQLNRGCDGIKEVFSSRNFLFQHKQQDKK